MTKNHWIAHRAREVELLAASRTMGVERKRAADLAFRLACAPLPRKQAALLVLQAADPTILNAWYWLLNHEPESTPPLYRIRVAALPDGKHGECDHGVISINPTSSFYVAAVGGNVLPLSMLIAHEYFHSIHGSAERPALEASLAFCERHHASDELIETLQRRISRET